MNNANRSNSCLTRDCASVKQVAAPQPPQSGAATVLKPNPEWLVTVQPASEMNGKQLPGYVQIDELDGEGSNWSRSISELRSLGYEIREDFSRLPCGQYLLSEAQALLNYEESQKR